MAKKQNRQNQKRLVVSMCRVATPDAEERLSRAIDILLRAAGRTDDDGKQAEGAAECDDEEGDVGDVETK